MHQRHDELRVDPLLATLVEKADPTGQDRRRELHAEGLPAAATLHDEDAKDPTREF